MSLQDLTKEAIKNVVEKNEIVIIDFWAEWCGPCKRFTPIFERVAAKHPDIKFVKVNTDQEEELSANFEIKSIPTLAVIKQQQIILLQPGALPEEALEQIIQRARDVDMSKVESE
ncbi:MAG: thioredoxin [Pseudobdellovibrionaceae bacterium]